MGFYGNVFYELTNAFSILAIKHHHDLADTTSMTVKGINGRFTLAPNNEWISLTADSDNVVCGITHKEDNLASGGSMTSLEPVDSAPTDIATLNLGQVFKTTSFNYDKAGHIVSTSEQYFKLPITDTEAEVGDLNERVSKLEVNDTNKEGRLVLVEETIGSYNDTINGFEGRIVDMEEQLVNELEPMVESYNKLRPWIGEQSEIAKDPKDEEDSTTITETIGNIWDATKRIGVKEGKENIAGCLEKLNENLSTTDTQIKANLTATKVALQRLLDELSKYHDIEIDNDYLWKP